MVARASISPAPLAGRTVVAMSEIRDSGRQPLRFGTFELDLTSGELRKAGVLVSLQEQSLRVLLALLERPGELVSREHLHQRLWPDGTFVDFEHGLNAVINRLRDTLGDSADTPRLIETLPRRGYRFIGSIDRPHAGGASEPSAPAREEATDTKASAEGTRRYGRVIWSGVVLTLAISLTPALYLYRSRPAPPLPLRTIPLTTLPGKERYPSFSPEGDRIAFVWDGEKNNDDIYVKVIGTEDPFRLTTSPAREGYPVWSPDGRHISFLRASAEGSGLFVIPALGGAERKVLSRSVPLDGCPGTSWSPDGQFLVTGDLHQGTCVIFLVSLETLQKRKLTSPPQDTNGDRAPAFSPDGRTIAFHRIGPVGGGIYVVPAAGGEPTRVTTEQYLQLERLTWLPTGRELVFSSAGSDFVSSSSLWRVSASGGTPERLGIGGDNAANPAVSPRGNRLAYEQPRLDANIWKIALPQSTRPGPLPARLTASSWQDGGPQFSPDGASIAFHSDRSGSDEIWLCDTTGANLVQLTSFGHSLDGFAGTPRWSPDSRQLVFEARVKGHPGLYVINADGGVPRQVMIEPFGYGVVASWSSDGHWIYFGAKHSGRWEIWKVRAGGGRAVQVTKGGGFAAFESADRKFLYYAKGKAAGPDADGLWKVPVNGGEETAVLDLPKAGFWGYWALVKDGIYLVDAEASPRPALRFFDFGTRRVANVLDLDKKPIEHAPGISISPDGGWLLYTQDDSRGGDIMLVENFDRIP